MSARPTITALLLTLCLSGCGNADGVLHYTIKFNKNATPAIDGILLEIKTVANKELRGTKEAKGNAAFSWKIPTLDIYDVDFTYVSSREEQVRAWLTVSRQKLNKQYEVMGQAVASDAAWVVPGEVVEVDWDLRTFSP